MKDVIEILTKFHQYHWCGLNSIGIEFGPIIITNPDIYILVLWHNSRGGDLDICKVFDSIEW